MRRIGLFIEMQYGYGATIVEGIAGFAREQLDWEIDLYDLPPNELLRAMKGFEGDGAIATLASPQMVRLAQRYPRPLVNVSGGIDAKGVPTVRGDESAVGLMAAEYLLDRRFRRFVALSNPRNPSLARRADAFHQVCARSRTEASVIDVTRLSTGDDLTRLFRSFSPPIAAFCADDRIGIWALRAARTAGLIVPDDIAILAAGNDARVCELVHPTLSSVDGNLQRRGHTAAALLARLLASGHPPANSTILVPPREVVSRQSTNAYAIADDSVARALRHVREHVGEQIDIEQLALASSVSRRTLEMRMLKVMSRTIQQEIWRQRVLEAKRLLRRTDRSITEIAYACGFASASALSVVFRRETGRTPRDFRVAAASAREA